MTTTGPLRPPDSLRPELAQWLREQLDQICEPWLKSVRVTPPYVEGLKLEPPEEFLLRQLYHDLCFGLERGYFTKLDETVAAVTLDAREHGYRLNDLLNIFIMLKAKIWQAIVNHYAVEQALSYTHALTISMDGALAYTARVFNEEATGGLSSALEKSETRLSQLDDTKRNFINIAAHELKTPLTLIQGYSNILLDELVDSSDEHVMAIASGIESGTRRLEEIINNMIAVSMIDKKTLEIHRQLMSLNHVLERVMDDLKSEMGGRDVTLILHPTASKVKHLRADPQRLYEAFTHVISNSIKYTPDGGQVDVRASVIEADDDEPVVEVKVADNGIGIAPERRELIFEMFYGTQDIMTHSSGRTKFKGSGPGLGLAITKGIVEAHGGKIWADSPGYDEKTRPGTTITILLPMRAQTDGP